MLKKCIFIGPVIPCDALYCLASCLTSNVFTQLHLILVLSFSRSRKIGYFPKQKKMRHLLFWMVVYILAV